MLIVRIQTNAAGLVEARRARLNKGAVDLVGVGGTEIEAVADLSRQLVEENQIPYRVRKATVRTAAKLPRKGSKVRAELEAIAAVAPLDVVDTKDCDDAVEDAPAVLAVVEKECDGCCEDCPEDDEDEYDDEYEEEEDEDEEEF